jgi:hypothetical protein
MSPEKADELRAKIAELERHLEAAKQINPFWVDRIKVTIEQFRERLRKAEAKNADNTDHRRRT